MFTVALLALAVAGCTTTGTPTVQPTDTTPSAIPTQTPPTGTPVPGSWLNGYSEYLKGGTQQLPGNAIPPAECTFEAVYHDADWTMPYELLTLNGYAEHGAIYKLRFTNPTGEAYTIVAGDTVKSTFPYYYNGKAGIIPTSDTFYDPGTKTEYGTVVVPAGNSREVYMLAFITNNSNYETYGSYITNPSLDLNPHYFEQVR
jgi:hypothetical protein